MTIDIHKIITGNPISKNLMKPWGSNAKSNSIRGKLFNRYTGPGNNLKQQLDFNPYTGEIYKIYDQPSSSNDRCSMYHDVAYTVAQNLGGNSKDIKKRKLDADKEWLDCFKSRSPWDIAAYSAIKSKKVLGLGNGFNMEHLSQELNKPVINKFERKKVSVSYIDEIHSCDLVDMQKYSKMNKGYKYIFTNIDIFSEYAWSFPLKTKTIKDIKLCFEKIFKERKSKCIWSDQESAFFSKEMLKFFEDNNVKIYHTYSNLKAVVIERFNRSLRELMMKSFVKNNNTVWYNVLANLIKSTVYNYDITNKKPKYKINDLVRISLKRRELFDKPTGNIKWSEELFKIYRIHKSNVITYQLKDMNDEIIKGIFYEKELQLSKHITGEYIIEKILKTNKNETYVKWRGYNSSFNSWINKNSVTKYI